MPTYKNSKTQSKNGGRRRKQTKRKLRRGRKSRKVMRGGASEYVTKLSNKSDSLYNILLLDPTIIDRVTLRTLISQNIYGFTRKKWYKDLHDVEEVPPDLTEDQIIDAIITKLEEK